MEFNTLAGYLQYYWVGLHAVRVCVLESNRTTVIISKSVVFFAHSLRYLEVLFDIAVITLLYVTFEPFIAFVTFVVYLAQARIAPRAIVSHTFQQHSVSHSVSPIKWRFTWHQAYG